MDKLETTISVLILLFGAINLYATTESAHYVEAKANYDQRIISLQQLHTVALSVMNNNNEAINRFLIMQSSDRDISFFDDLPSGGLSISPEISVLNQEYKDGNIDRDTFLTKRVKIEYNNLINNEKTLIELQKEMFNEFENVPKNEIELWRLIERLTSVLNMILSLGLIFIFTHRNKEPIFNKIKTYLGNFLK